MTIKKVTIKNYWVTPEDVIRFEPCKDDWPVTRVMNWFGGRKKVRLTTILTDGNIPKKDRLWIFSNVIYYRYGVGASIRRSEVSTNWWPGYANVTLDRIIQAIE